MIAIVGDEPSRVAGEASILQGSVGDMVRRLESGRRDMLVRLFALPLALLRLSVALR